MGSQPADYNMLMNDLGDFLIYKRKLYVLRILSETILQECYDAYIRDNLGVILLAKDNLQYMRVLQEL